MGLYVVIVILSALASLIAFPVAGGFRVSMGIVVLFTAIHLYKIRQPIQLSAATGIAVVLTRILVASFSSPMTVDIATNYFLELFFYLGYGIIYYYAIANNATAKYPLPDVVALGLADGGGNFFEYYLRYLAAGEAWVETSLMTILLAAVFRAVAIILLVWVLSRFVKKEPQPKGGRHD